MEDLTALRLLHGGLCRLCRERLHVVVEKYDFYVDPKLLTPKPLLIFSV